jgi:hypothetical protein
MSKMTPTYISQIIPSQLSLSVQDFLNKSPQQVLKQVLRKLQTNRIARNLKLQSNRNVLIVKEPVIWKISVLISILVTIVASPIIHQKNVATNKNQPD